MSRYGAHEEPEADRGADALFEAEVVRDWTGEELDADEGNAISQAWSFVELDTAVIQPKLPVNIDAKTIVNVWRKQRLRATNQSSNRSLSNDSGGDCWDVPRPGEEQGWVGAGDRGWEWGEWIGLGSQ